MLGLVRFLTAVNFWDFIHAKNTSVSSLIVSAQVCQFLSENEAFLFQDGPINPAEICPLIPPQSGDRLRSPETDLTRIFLDVLLELMVTQVPLIEWKEEIK